MDDPSSTMTHDVFLALMTTWMNKGMLWAFLSNGRSLSEKETILLGLRSNEATISLGLVSEEIFVLFKAHAKAF